MQELRQAKETCQRFKDSAHKETHVVSATIRTNVENGSAHPLLPQNRSRKAMGKDHREESLSKAGVRLGRDLEDRAKTTSIGNSRTLVCFLESSRVSESQKSGCKFGETCSFVHRDFHSHSSPNGKRMVCEGSVALLKNSRQLGCAAEIQIDFMEGPKILGTKAQEMVH